MKKGKEIYFADILTAINKIEDYIGGLKKSTFVHNSLIHDAVLREVEIIGEAVKYIGDDVRKQYPEVDWSDIVAMRNFISHEYRKVDLPLTFRTIKKDLPKLKKVVENLLK